MPQGGKQSLIGLDLNAGRARAVAAAPGHITELLPLAGEAELPLALSLEGRTPEVGGAGLAVARRAPHLACANFLPYLGNPREWAAGRHRLNAAQAVALVFDRLRPACGHAQMIGLAVPAYLSPEQVELLAQLAVRSRLRVGGWVAAPMAVTLAAYAEQPWEGPALVVDIDEHALTCAALTIDLSQARVCGTLSHPQLGMRAWKGRLLDGAADRCIRQCRRDPRDSAPAEQMLYDQLENAFDACRRGQIAELIVHMPQWGQNLMFRPDELIAACTPLLRQALAPVRTLRDLLPPGLTPTLLVTEAASRLPGLVAALEEASARKAPVPEREADCEDFGEGLLELDESDRGSVRVLSPDAAARAACDLAGRWQRGELARGPVEVGTLPPPLPADAGPARLQFRNQDYPLRGLPFLLGRHADCDLVFDSDQYPTVSAWHCEVMSRRRSFVLRDLSRHGTLVNDWPVDGETVLQAGDWIRLGPGGPLLRFLGHAADQLKLMTTA
jgi:FHA domain-containing protein